MWSLAGAEEMEQAVQLADFLLEQKPHFGGEQRRESRTPYGVNWSKLSTA
jgi:hypothetical protein